jgi:hypothetical protein
LPCRACGVACNSITDVIMTPFFPYLAVTFCLNMPGVFFGAKGLGFQCPSLSSWLVINGVLCVGHMIASIYIVNSIRETPPQSSAIMAFTGDAEAQTPTTDYKNFTVPKENEHGHANSFARVKYVLCHDKIMAVYIVCFIGWVLWLSAGVAKRLGADDCDNEGQFMSVAISCGYLYFSLVFMAFGCSLCCLR